MKWIFLIASVCCGIGTLFFLSVGVFYFLHHPVSAWWRGFVFVPIAMAWAAFTRLAFLSFLNDGQIPDEPTTGTTPTRGLLQDRSSAIGIWLCCSYFVVPPLTTMTEYRWFLHDSVSIFGLAFCILVTASVTYRSPFSLDRVVFGAGMAAFLLEAVRMLHLTRMAVLAIKASEAFMWTIAAAVSLVAVVRSFKVEHAK